MKRLAILVLALAMSLSMLASCSNSPASSTPASTVGSVASSTPSSSEASSSTSVPSESVSSLDSAISQLSTYLISLGLLEDEYGFTQYGVWNSDLLPECVPTEPEDGVVVDRTEYKDTTHNALMDMYTVGNITFPDKNYERHLLVFTSTEAQLDTFIGGMVDNGFEFGNPYQEHNQTNYEWLGNGYYAHLGVRENGADDKLSVTLQITPTLGNEHPLTFNGTPLPTFGIVPERYGNEGNGWNSSEDAEAYDYWDVYADEGTLPELWNIWFNYHMVSTLQAEEYVQLLVHEGWELLFDGTSFSSSYDIDTFFAQLRKDGVYVAVDTSLDGCHLLAVRFGTEAESLYY